MKTPFDLLSVLLFAVIAVIFLHRSSKDESDPVPLWAYAATAAACAVGDVLANHEQVLPGAALLFGAAGGVVWIVFKTISASARLR